MKVAVLGTGNVGRTIAQGLAGLGHTVTVGTRDPEITLSRSGPDAMGAPSFSEWQVNNQGVALKAFGEVAVDADIIVNATSGQASLAVLESVGAAALAGKIIIDIANPLDFSNGMPPSLFVKDTDSLGEQIQRAYPHARVVKTLNTLNAALMTHPDRLTGPSTVFVSGNDADAKNVVTALLNDFGHQDVIDLGDITTARGTEMLMPVWLRLWGALGTADFNFKIVR